MEIKQFAEESAHINYTYKVTPDVYYSFQRCSNDYNPLHTDAAFAAKKGFDKIVVYGNVLNAFVSHFVGMLLPTRDVMILGQNISFRKPVFLNDELELEAKMEKCTEDLGLITYALKFRKKSDRGGGKNELIANGHVQISVINDKEI